MIQCSTLGKMSVTYRIPNAAFLGLLVFLSLFSGFGTAETIVDTNPHVFLEVGTRGILPCRIQRRGYSVDWKRQLPSGTELLVSLDVLFDVGKRVGPGYEAGLFNITDDYSLVIKDVKVQDEGLYMCSFSDYQTGKPFQNSTRVSVQAFPDEPFPVIQECIGKNVNSGACTLAIHQTYNLTCLVKGYYPDIDLFFLHGSEKMASNENEEWYNADGTKNKEITIQISVSDEPYECVASSWPGMSGNRSVTVIVKAIHNGPRAAVIVAPVLVVGICLSIAVICYLGNRRCRRRGFMPILMRTPIDGPVSKLELWKLVKKARESDVFKKLRAVVRRLRRLSETDASKLENADEFYESLCQWKSDTSSNSNQRKELYSVCYKEGMSKIIRTLEDFIRDTFDEVSRTNIDHILWDIGDPMKIIELLKALGLDHEAVVTANETGRKDVIGMARNELLKWRVRRFDMNPVVILSLKLDELEYQSNFFKLPLRQKEEIDVEEMKDICCQVFKLHFTSLLKAIRDNHEELAYQIKRFVEENNVSLFDTLQMLKDWEQNEHCSYFEKRSKLQEAVEAASQRDHTASVNKWPPDDDLRVIASFLSPASMEHLCSKLGIRSPHKEDSEEERFQTLTEWRDNPDSSKDLKEKHTELFTALNKIKRGGLVPRVKGPLVYKVELVDLAFHLFAQDLLPFTEALGITAAKLVDYRPSFQPSRMRQGTIGLVCKLFESRERSDLLYLLKQMPYPNVYARGMLALEISFEEVCSIACPATCQKQETKRPHLTRSQSSSPGNHNTFTGVVNDEEKTCLDEVKLSLPLENPEHEDATYNEHDECVQQGSQNEIANGLVPMLTMLTSARQAKDHKEVSPESSAFLKHFKLWREHPRMIPFNFRLVLANHLKNMDTNYPISHFLQGSCNDGKIPFTFIADVLNTVDPEQRCNLGHLIRAAPFNTLEARLSIFPVEDDEWFQLADAVRRNMHDWAVEWIKQITEVKRTKPGKDSILTTTEIAEKHREFNDKLVDHGFIDLAREIMISERQLMDKQHAS